MRHTQTNWLRNDYTTHFTCNQNQTKYQNHLLLSSTEMKVVTIWTDRLIKRYVLGWTKKRN
jgi:hypothetical protein